jgi:AAA domain-containing protein
VSYPHLRLNGNPFIPIPPISRYEKGFRQLFTARFKEVHQICRLAAGARALFVIAPYGGGKTMVLLEALSRMRDAGTTTVYVTFDREKGFCRVLWEGLLSSGLEVIGSEHGERESLHRTIRRLRDGGASVVLAADDLDRATDTAEVFQVTHDVRELLAEGVGVVVTGQPFGVTFDLHTSAGGLFSEVKIPEFTAPEFEEMLERYLRSVRLDVSAPAFHPFDKDGVSFICKEMAAAKMTPRLFNFALSELIDSAEAAGEHFIILQTVLEYWPTIAQRTVRGLTAYKCAIWRSCSKSL